MVYQVNALSTNPNKIDFHQSSKTHNVERIHSKWSSELFVHCGMHSHTLNEMKSCKEFFIWEAKTHCSQYALWVYVLISFIYTV